MNVKAGASPWVVARWRSSAGRVKSVFRMRISLIRRAGLTGNSAEARYRIPEIAGRENDAILRDAGVLHRTGR
jgi:hypothetical protein